MKTISKILLIGILALSFDKPAEPHTYIIKGDFQTWVYTYNYLEKIKKTFENSDMPSKQVKAMNDTIFLIQNLIMSQLEPQFAKYQKEDSIANANIKKDSTGKHKK